MLCGLVAGHRMCQQVMRRAAAVEDVVGGEEDVGLDAVPQHAASAPAEV